MSISITLAVTALVFLLGMYIGGMKGFADSVAGFVALAVAVFMLIIFIRIISAYGKGDIKETIIAVVVLIILGIVYSILKVVTKSIQAVAELPILGAVDKILGAALGFLVALVLFHAVMTLAELGYLAGIGDNIIKEAEESKILTQLRALDIFEIVKNVKEKIADSI